MASIHCKFSAMKNALKAPFFRSVQTCSEDGESLERTRQPRRKKLSGRNAQMRIPETPKFRHVLNLQSHLETAVSGGTSASIESQATEQGSGATEDPSESAVALLLHALAIHRGEAPADLPKTTPRPQAQPQGLPRLRSSGPPNKSAPNTNVQKRIQKHGVGGRGSPGHQPRPQAHPEG